MSRDRRHKLADQPRELRIRPYGHRAGPDEPVEMVTIEVIGQGLPDRPRVPAKLLPSDASTASRLAARQAYFGPQLGWLTTPVLHRAELSIERL